MFRIGPLLQNRPGIWSTLDMGVRSEQLAWRESPMSDVSVDCVLGYYCCVYLLSNHTSQLYCETEVPKLFAFRSTEVNA